MPRSELEARRKLDPETFAAHYQQTPIPPGGIIIRKAWLRYYDLLPPRNSSSAILQSWDAASKSGESNDWSVCTTWLIQDGKYYLMHVLRDRLDYPSLRARAIEHARAYTANKIIVEELGIGVSLIQELAKSLAPGCARPTRTQQGHEDARAIIKVSGRAGVLTASSAMARRITRASFYHFRRCDFDDQVDSTTQALAVDPSGYDMVRWRKVWHD